MKLGFVGNGTDKFTELGEKRARDFISAQIWGYLEDLPGEGLNCEAMVSGHSPVGGIDIWAEEEATNMGVPLDLKIPEVTQWNPPGGYGYKARNLDIARDSDVLCVIVANEYPTDYKGRRFKECYHCKSIGRNATDHVKSGGCWTGKKALEMGKQVIWHIVEN